MIEINKKLNEYYAGKVVRKDLTKKIKEGANVPVYVLEYLLGMYCSCDDNDAIEEGMQRVKKILADNFVRPDESEKIKSKIRECGQYTIIDKVTVKLDEKKDEYVAELSNLGTNCSIPTSYVTTYEKLLVGGIWVIATVRYVSSDDEDTKKHGPIFVLDNIKPIQMPNMDMEDFKSQRHNFTKDEWIDVLVRSSGIEPSHLEYRQKWHFLERLVPLVENNYNVCELGPRGTGKSHVYKEISPNSILVSGGQTTVANLFYNMSTRKIGLVGLWDTVAFDEVAGIEFKDKDGVQIMKDYMASGSFARGKEEKNAKASMVFVGNINQSVDVILKTSHLFEPFPEAMAHDSAFFDRMHYYIPGWEIPKMRPELITNEFGFIVDYFAEFMKEMRKISYSDAFDKYYTLGKCLNQRDVIAVRKTVSGLIKLMYPDGVFNKEDVEEILRYALEGRRRVKEQLKKIGGMEFYDVQFTYIDKDSYEEKGVGVPEQGGDKIIPEGEDKPGHIYSVNRSLNGMFGVYKLETEVTPGSGKFDKLGIEGKREVKEALDTAFNYFKINKNSISANVDIEAHDYIMHVQDIQGVGHSGEISISALIAICSGLLKRPIQPQMVVLGSMSIGSTINKLEELANQLQVAFDAGAKKLLLPSSSIYDLATVPPELLTYFQISYYNSPEDAVFKALGV